MNKTQWRVFILFTIPFCAVALAFWISNIWNESKDINLRMWNVWSSKTTYPSYAQQEKLEIWNLK